MSRITAKLKRQPLGGLVVSEEQQVPPLRFASVPRQAGTGGMTRLFGGGGFRGRIREGDGRTADPSAALRFGRDDKGEGRASIQIR